MSAFLTELEVVELVDDDRDGRSLWRLDAPLVYQSDVAARTITVPAGFVTDFASVPRIPVAWYVAGGEGNKAAVVHDYLYTSHLVERPIADAVFEEALAATGQPWWRRKLMWAGVRLFGGTPYDQDFEDAKGETP